jgi:predicted ATPase
VGFAAGRHLGPYEILSLVGSGGMGEVYRARDPKLNRIIAIKVLPEKSAASPERRARFAREAQSIAALSHPNIVTIHSVEEAEGLLFLTMEYVDGKPFSDVMVNGGMPLTQILTLAIPLADAISAAHQKGFTHRDLKPANVMIGADGRVKVLDFGLAKLMEAPSIGMEVSSVPADTLTEEGRIVGTVAYMSPEQAEGKPVDSCSDVFSLGIMLYEMATGERPFRGETNVSVLSAILKDTPPSVTDLNPSMPREFAHVVKRCLTKEKGRRYQTALDVRNELEELRTELKSGGITPTATQPAAAAVIAVTAHHTVGRDLAFAEMRRGFESTADGQGAVIALSGEPGIGKTTMAEAFLESLAATGELCYVGRGRCSERQGSSGAYLPWLEALEALRNQGGTPTARAMKTLAPTWYAQVAPPDTGDTAEARALTVNRAGSQEWMKRELCAFLEELARNRQVILFFDDLHWADESTVDILAYVADRLRSRRILVIATYRPSELLLVGHAFLMLKLDLEARGICREVPLEFLTAADVGRYLDLEFPSHRFPRAFAALVHDKTEGNPLFMVDLVRSFRDRGVIRSSDDSWELSQVPAEFERDIPVSIRSMIELKIRRLDDADRRLLTVASVAGAEFTSAVVARVLEIDLADLEDRLHELGYIHALVRPVREEALPDRSLSIRYRFIHVLYQNALYAVLGPTRRASLSLKVAEAMLAVYGGQSIAHALELGCLFEVGRDFSRAADFFLAASERARQIYANREALALAERAITMVRMLPDTPERVPRELVHLMGVAMATHGVKGYAAPELDGMYGRIRQLCDSLGENPQIFPALAARAIYHFMRAELAPQYEAMEQMRRLSDMTGDPLMAICTEMQHGATHSHFVRRLEDAMHHLDRGVQLYDPAMHPGFMLMTGFNPGLGCAFQGARVAWMLGRSDEAASRIEACVAEARRLGHPMMIAFSLFFQAWIRQHGRDANGVLAVMRELLPVIELYGYPDVRAWANILNGWAEAQKGRAAEGEAAIRQSLTVLDAIGMKLIRPNFLALLAEAVAAQGRIDEALTVLDEAAATAVRTEERCYLSEIHRLSGEWLAATGRATPPDIEQARRHLQLAVAIAQQQGARAFEQRAAASLARLARG